MLIFLLDTRVFYERNISNIFPLSVELFATDEHGHPFIFAVMIFRNLSKMLLDIIINPIFRTFTNNINIEF